MIEMKPIPDQDNEPLPVGEKEQKLLLSTLNTASAYGFLHLDPALVIGLFAGHLAAMIENHGPEHKQDVINFLEKEINVP